MPRTKNTTPELVPFKLSAPHEHAGKPCVPGDVIMLRPDQVEWLAKLGKGEVTTKPINDDGVDDHAI